MNTKWTITWSKLTNCACRFCQISWEKHITHIATDQKINWPNMVNKCMTTKQNRLHDFKFIPSVIVFAQLHPLHPYTCSLITLMECWWILHLSQWCELQEIGTYREIRTKKSWCKILFSLSFFQKIYGHSSWSYWFHFCCWTIQLVSTRMAEYFSTVGRWTQLLLSLWGKEWSKIPYFVRIYPSQHFAHTIT